MDGHGFSYSDCIVAIKVVANLIFKQNWQVEKDRISKYNAESPDEKTGKLMKSWMLKRELIYWAPYQQKSPFETT